jgi:DUF1365 family protein
VHEAGTAARIGTEADAELLTGTVMHRRLRPVENRFSYGVFFLRLRLSALERTGNALFSLNRFNLASFHYRDHGARDGTHPLTWIRALLAREGLACADGEVWLQCFPRVLGYVFNPVSFWYCHDRGGALRAILAEVNNTFGETHAYLLAQPDGAPIADGDEMQARKVFHVSPFFPVAGGYRFRFGMREGLRTARIDYYSDPGAEAGEAAQPLLLTAVSGRAQPLRAPALLRACLTHPMMTVGVVARIHWQALRLWLRRVPFFSKPRPPLERVTR